MAMTEERVREILNEMKKDILTECQKMIEEGKGSEGSTEQKDSAPQGTLVLSGGGALQVAEIYDKTRAMIQAGCQQAMVQVCKEVKNHIDTRIMPRIENTEEMVKYHTYTGEEALENFHSAVDERYRPERGKVPEKRGAHQFGNSQFMFDESE